MQQKDTGSAAGSGRKDEYQGEALGVKDQLGYMELL